MERLGSFNGSQHVIEIAGSADASTSSASPHDRHFSGVDAAQHEERISGVRMPLSQPSVSTSSVSNGTNSRNSSFIRRGDTRRNRSPVHSGLWISIELVLLVGQIVASIVVLSLSRHEHPRTPLFQWIVGYASGCAATLPLLYWRYYHHNHMREQDSSLSRQTSPRINDPSGTLLSSSRTNGGEDGHPITVSSRSIQASVLMNRRMKTLVEYFKISLDCFFAVWFVVGNVWIFGGHSSADEAPNLYRLCIVFLAFSCIGYAMPFILCSTICCCLPCLISILGVREDLSQNRGATSESINALPTYKFKTKKNKRNGEGNIAAEGGIVAAGTEKERVISGEDAVCCICLAKYENNDELRELPCSHLFHKDCVDKWLKINALCPLCKSEVGESLTGLVSGEDASQQRVENGLTNTSV
ncbi:E3 ubiquitin-protein ligase At1g63170-like [Abrus precatorius]|uniref:E3 ubiquitin-protein ligase At1g63170-like n=1 Tax=Abrus precatorius TaxID=3816 RepID=A0A8B8JG86_ABRPR|nr:E3 ubiquitin-protein ligase At1g63170-like [Abrus precatorius]XP_027330367.1 E3 ubiquitin-protein ligase At1g63170-like [Abrus precatorius]XP_027330368.1 E3 ubiquitin-protein ligase At1g63170-like [Abrus precatorius]